MDLSKVHAMALPPATVFPTSTARKPQRAPPSSRGTRKFLPLLAVVGTRSHEHLGFGWFGKHNLREGVGE